MNSNDLTNCRCITRKAEKTPSNTYAEGLTRCQAWSILYVLPSKRNIEEETHDRDTNRIGGAGQISGVYIHPKTEKRTRQDLLLCFTPEGQKDARSIYLSSISFRANDQRSGARETSQDKVKAARRRQLTIENLVTRNSSPRLSAKLMRDGPRYLIPTFSIAKETKSCQWLHKKWVQDERREDTHE